MLLSTVSSLVVVKNGTLTEGFPTLSAFIGFLASVHSLVHNEL